MKMKKSLITLFTFTLLFACSEQEQTPLNATALTDGIAERNWQESNLTKTFFENQKNVSHYNFNKKDISNALAISNVTSFRFVLGLQYDELRIIMVGIDNEGKEVVSVPSAVYLDPGNYAKAIDLLEHSSMTYSADRKKTSVVGKHLLTYSNAFSYISKWKALLDNKDIFAAITNSGIRYRYYSLEKEVVADMIAPQNVASIGLFLGLNAENELTTVFLQKDNSDLLILNSNLSSSRDINDGDVFDFTSPCPDWCGKCKCADGTIIDCGRECADESTPVPID